LGAYGSCNKLLLAKVVDSILMIQLGTEGLSLSDESKLLLLEKLKECLMRSLLEHILDFVGEAVETFGFIFTNTRLS